MDQYYSAFLKRFDKLEGSKKIVTICGALVATGLATYCLKRVFIGGNGFSTKEKGGEEAIPTPEGAVYYLGHIPQMGAIPAHKITEWHRKLGPILRIKMGIQDWVFISDPNIAHDIFVSQGAITSGRPFITFGNGIVGEGNRGIVFADYGKKWKNARTALLGILSPKSVEGFDQTLQHEAERCVNQLIKETQRHGEVNPLEFARCSSISVILSIAFGIPGIKSPDDPFFKELVHIIEMQLYYASVLGDISAYLPILSFLDVIFRKEAKMRKFANNEVFPLFRKLIQSARESNQDSLVKKLDLIKDELEIDERNVMVIMAEVLAAGGDTVSIATSWTYAILCHYPDVQKKLAEEVDSFITKHRRIPTFEDRLELPYYIAVQKECIRFRPPVYFIVPRKASKDILYKNYVIPKGTTLVSNIHTLHSSSDTFPEPDKFIPERFLNDSRSMYACGNGNVHNRDQFVFGWGRRICPGIYLAENELFNNITRVMARCTIEPALNTEGIQIYPDLDDVRDGGATLLPAPFKVRFVERENRLIV